MYDLPKLIASTRIKDIFYIHFILSEFPKFWEWRSLAKLLISSSKTLSTRPFQSTDVLFAILKLWFQLDCKAVCEFVCLTGNNFNCKTFHKNKLKLPTCIINYSWSFTRLLTVCIQVSSCCWCCCCKTPIATRPTSRHDAVMIYLILASTLRVV